MITKILVALDPDSDTPVAVRYAAEIARRYDAAVTGLAVVDMENIEAGSRGGGIGSMYYAEKLRGSLTEEARDTARALIDAFAHEMEGANVRFTDSVKEGVPFRRIVEDMNYHDLLVVGKEPHFFYSHPEERTRTLAKVVKETIAPTLVVGDTYRPVERVLVAYDASPASARALRRFAHLKPFGADVQVEILHIYKDDENESELVLRLAKEYLDGHGYSARTISVKGDAPDRQIVEYAGKMNADLVVAGAHSVSKIRKLTFGSTTDSLLKNSPVPLFVDH